MEDQLLRHSRLCVVILVLALCFPLSAGQLSSSDARLLFRFRRLLEYPPALAGWNSWTNLCYLPPSPSLKIVCSGTRITELSVVGDRAPPTSPSSKPFAVSQKSLSSSFSLDSLFTTLSKLSGLESLSLVSLGMWGPLPRKINRFSSLRVLNLSSNFIYGEIPPQISSLSNLTNLSLGNNLLNGTVPDLTNLQVLEELDLGKNQLGPEFPVLGNKIIVVVLGNNAFRSTLPIQLERFNKMQRLDISYNHLVGPIPPRLFSLPSIHYLNLAGNNLTGELPASVSCANQLAFVDLSRNRLVGRLPLCISFNSSTRAVSFSWNCLSSSEGEGCVAGWEREREDSVGEATHRREGEGGRGRTRGGRGRAWREREGNESRGREPWISHSPLLLMPPDRK